MQYEWQTPRAFPASSFGVATSEQGGTSTGAGEEDGERARKRMHLFLPVLGTQLIRSAGTHYEAMDVDTPPRPTPAIPSFPSTATATSNPFHFAPPPSPPAAAPEPHLSFDPESFSPKKAFGLATKRAPLAAEAEEEDSKALTFLGGFHGEGGEARRRRGSRRERSPERRHARALEEEEEEEDDVGGMMGELGVGGAGGMGRRLGSSEFSFQVHHHHGTSGSEGAPGAAPPERWLNRSTPYVLLGYALSLSRRRWRTRKANHRHARSYLQFASLALLSVLFLFISILFLQTLYTDIQSRLSSLTLEIRSEIMQCAKAYVDNRCEPATRIPAMERKCSGWEECMGREVVVVGKTRVVAETLAEVVNGFVDVISFKTMVRRLPFARTSRMLTLLDRSSSPSSHSASRSMAPPSPFPFSPRGLLSNNNPPTPSRHPTSVRPISSISGTNTHLHRNSGFKLPLGTAQIGRWERERSERGGRRRRRARGGSAEVARCLHC